MPEDGISDSALPDEARTAAATSWRSRIEGLAKFAGARAALATFEGREAGANYLRSALYAFGALVFGVVCYFLTVFLAIVALVEFCGMNLLAALGLGVGFHALGLIILGILAAKGFTKPAFRVLREQLRKDKEWMDAGRKS